MLVRDRVRLAVVPACRSSRNTWRAGASLTVAEQARDPPIVEVDDDGPGHVSAASAALPSVKPGRGAKPATADLSKKAAGATKR